MAMIYVAQNHEKNEFSDKMLTFMSRGLKGWVKSSHFLRNQNILILVDLIKIACSLFLLYQKNPAYIGLLIQSFKTIQVLKMV